MAPTAAAPLIEARVLTTRTGLTYWATAPEGYFSTTSTPSESTPTSVVESTPTSALEVLAASSSASSFNSPATTPMPTESASSSHDATLATDPAAPITSTESDRGTNHTAAAVAASLSVVFALLLAAGGAAYWRRRRLRLRQQGYRDYPRRSQEKKRAMSPPMLIVDVLDISPANSAYPSAIDPYSGIDRSSSSHYLSSLHRSVSSVHRSDFFSESPSSSGPQTASTDLIGAFPFPAVSSPLPRLPEICVTVSSPTHPEFMSWAQAQRILGMDDDELADAEDPFRTPRASVVSVLSRTRTVSERPAGARPLHSRTPSLGSLSRAASPPTLSRTASFTRLHSRSASVASFACAGASARGHARSASAASLGALCTLRSGRITAMDDDVDSSESATSSSLPTPTAFAALDGTRPIHEAEEEEEEPRTAEDPDSPIDPGLQLSRRARPAPEVDSDSDNFLQPVAVSERRLLRNRHSASLLTQASGVSIATLPGYTVGMSAGEWFIQGGRLTPVPAYEMNRDGERVNRDGERGWSTLVSVSWDEQIGGLRNADYR